jgi:hypothetical protein
VQRIRPRRYGVERREPGQRIDLEQGRAAARRRQLRQIADQSVRDVDAGARQRQQRLAQRHAWLRKKEARLEDAALCGRQVGEPSRHEGGEPRRGFARPTGDEQDIARAGAASAQALPRCDATQDLYTDRERPARGVTTDQRDAMLVRQITESCREGRKPRGIH